MSERYTVLISDTMHSAGTELLARKCRLVYAKSVEDFRRKAPEANALILIRNGEAFRDTIERATGLQAIGKHGVGLDKIDLAAARERRIPVVYTPDANSIGVAEHFVTLCLMLAKRMHRGDMLLRGGEWKNDPFDFLGSELHGKTLGVLGFGRIGQHIARICQRGFEMPVLYADVNGNPALEAELGARRVEIEELFSGSDFISVNLPLTRETRGLVDARLLGRMKSSAIIVNVARGPIWKEADLLRALKEGRIGAAGSDVFEQEPTSKDNPLIGLPNFIGTPHLAAHTEESMMRASLLLAGDLLSVLEGRAPRYPVPDSMYPSVKSGG